MANETDSICRTAISRSSARSSRAPAVLKAVLLLHLGWPLLFGGWAQSAGAEYFYVDYSKIVSPVHLRLYDLSIISPDAEVDLAEGHKLGHRLFSYLSIGEVASDAPYRKKAISRKIPFFGKNEFWQSDLVDLSHPDWTQFVIELAGEAVQKDFDGFFLDNVDTVDLLIQKYPDKAESFRSGLIDLIKKLKASYPSKKIILNRGFPIIEQLAGIVDGMLVESVFQTFDGAKKAYVAVAPTVTQELLNKLQKVKAAGFAIYIIDYVDPDNRELAAETARKIERLGYHALITTIDLQGRVLAPLAAKPRHLLTLFGNRASQHEDSIKWPSDSFFAKYAQMVVEWLGYEVDYFNASSNLPPSHLEAKYCGIMLDRFLDISPEKEVALADWLLAQKVRGSKLIFLGGIPFNQDEPRNRVLKALGMRGSGDLISHPGKIQIESLSEEMMNYEAKVRLKPGNLRVLQAPVNSKVYLSIAVESRKVQQHTFEPIFTAPWGGMVLDPFITFQRPDFHELWLLDPFKFFSAALEVDHGPVPDPTTRDGLRIFYSHIDGDGFGNKSVVEAGKCAAEIIRDQVIKVYPVPITFSIIEAEIRARLAGQKPEDEQKFRDIARSIFALPNVQAGSHTYTHPFFWIDDDRTAKAYERQTLLLSGTNRQDRVDLKREIVGSVKFINEELLPPGKNVSVFLWSGNCRPPPEAIRLVKELGLENMNGGETLISAKYPSISAVSPRVMPWGDELQIYAANQNENEFNDGWKGPFYGGYIHTIETFKRTETPRRLKPINIYYHLYCGDFHDALKVLCQVYDFALSQRIHALTARQYAEIVRDSRATSIFKKSDDHWILMNEGKLRTFRIASRGVVPDLFESKGVTGFGSDDGVLYIHTDGSPKVELVLSSHPQSHPYLISSSAEIEFQKLTTSQVAFTVSDLRPITVELGGLPAEAKLDVAINQELHALRSDAKGRLTLTLPRQANVTLPVPLSAH